MRVLVIHGSARANGNSELLCDEFLRGALEAGHTTEKISLRRLTIRPCLACHACYRTVDIVNALPKLELETGSRS